MALLMARAVCSAPPRLELNDFDHKLGSEWVYLGVPDTACYVVQDGHLRLFGSPAELNAGKGTTFAGFRPDSTTFSVTTRLTLFDTLDGDEAGLAVYQAPEGYLQCCLNNHRGMHRLKLRLTLKNIRVLLTDKAIGSSSELWLRVDDDGRNYTFSYSTDGGKFHEMESVDRSLLQPAVVGSGTGIIVGLYAYRGSSKFQAGPSYADFDFLEYQAPK